MKKKTPIDDFVGILSKESGEALELAIEENRKRHRKLSAERHRRFMREFQGKD